MRVQRFWGSARPPVKKNGRQIEKETLKNRMTKGEIAALFQFKRQSEAIP
jgi:hypothetical protein